jgi:hypothetical protein
MSDKEAIEQKYIEPMLIGTVGPVQPTFVPESTLLDNPAPPEIIPEKTE